MVDYKAKFQELINEKIIDPNAASARTKIFISSLPPGVSNEEGMNAPWSEELFLYILAQDADVHCLPYCGAYYDNGLLYPLYNKTNP